jgi:hypothetical protein
MRFLTPLAVAILVSSLGLARAQDASAPMTGVQFGAIPNTTANDAGYGATYGAQVRRGLNLGSVVLGGQVSLQDIDPAPSVGPTDARGNVRLQAGYDFGPAFGYGFVDGAQLQGGSGRDTGGAFGLGVEVPLTNRLSVGAEYMREDLGSFGGTTSVLDSDKVRLRASFRF